MSEEKPVSMPDPPKLGSTIIRRGGGGTFDAIMVFVIVGIVIMAVVVATLSSPQPARELPIEEHPYVNVWVDDEHGVVCYTKGFAMSCVKVTE